MSTRMPRGLGQVRLVIELETPRTGAQEWVRLTTSIPGRDGTLARVWTTVDGRMSDGTWQDIEASVMGQLLAVLEALGGAQLEFPV